MLWDFEACVLSLDPLGGVSCFLRIKSEFFFVDLSGTRSKGVKGQSDMLDGLGPQRCWLQQELSAAMVDQDFEVKKKQSSVVCRHVYRHVYGDVYGDVHLYGRACVDMCMYVCINMCIDMCIDMFTFTSVCIDTCIR